MDERALKRQGPGRVQKPGRGVEGQLDMAWDGHWYGRSLGWCKDRGGAGTGLGWGSSLGGDMRVKGGRGLRGCNN